MILKAKKKVEPEREKIVVLNSGGFDSVVLMNCLHLTQPEKELHSVHFRYGERNSEQQMQCVNKVCKKTNSFSLVIDLPEFVWTKGEFYNEGYVYSTQYLEYRNLVFLAYALSYAESIGAKEIYCAILADGQYADTNSVFLKGINSFSVKNSGIKVITPFNQMTKAELLSYAIQSKMTPDDYFSCDNPDTEGRPCGFCLDCIALDEINKVLTVDHPMKAFYRSGYDFSNSTFKKCLSEVPVTEVRALINNNCQLHCSHCFYGFEEMHQDQLSKEEYYQVLRKLVLSHGVKNIHFSGKEPLFNADILWYAEQIKREKLPCSFNLVTNGVNLPKYAAQLKKFGCEKIFLSVDDILGTNGVRSVHEVTDKALLSCASCKLPVEVFIDLHSHNFDRIGEIITYLESHYSITRYYIRTIRSIGNASNQDVLTGNQLDSVWEQLKAVASVYPKKEFEFSISIEYLDSLNGTVLDEDVQDCENLYTDRFAPNLYVRAEEFCHRYSGEVTLTPDGYLLGCASECACADYHKVSVGNVHDTDLGVLLERGRKVAMTCNDHYIGKEKIYCSCSKNFIENT